MADLKPDRPERGDGMDVIEHANCIPRDRHDRLIDKATEVIEAGERRMYEAMKERDEARQQLRGAVEALTTIRDAMRGYVDGGVADLGPGEIFTVADDAIRAAGGQ